MLRGVEGSVASGAGRNLSDVPPAMALLWVIGPWCGYLKFDV